MAPGDVWQAVFELKKLLRQQRKAIAGAVEG